MSEKTLRQELLEDAKRKPIRKVIQYDVFWDVTPDDIMWPDDDGDCLMFGGHYELRNTNLLRVCVPAGSNPAAVVRGLKKVIEQVEHDPETLCCYWGYDELEGSWGREVIEPTRGTDGPYRERKDNPVKTLEESEAAMMTRKAELESYLKGQLSILESTQKNIENVLRDGDFIALQELAEHQRRINNTDDIPF